MTTACTPGRARAAAVSIERMRPCATELRRITACSSPSRVRSSTYWPRPRRKRKVLDAFDRAPDVGIWLVFMFHVACVARLHELSLAERDIAQR
mgnify:CR=1 FL=1